MDEPLVIVDDSHSNCTILMLNRPLKRNALTIDLVDQLCRAIEQVPNNKSKRGIIFKGAGSAFCTGLDLNEAMNTALEEKSSNAIARLLRTIDQSPLVTIAVVHGTALAGGAGIVCACDLALAETETTFGFPEIRRGMVAAMVMPFILRLIPRRLVNQLLLTGETITTERAYEIGLINHISKTYSGIHDALKFVDMIVKGGPVATKKTKQLMKSLDALDINEALEKGLEIHRRTRQEEESKEGIAAFVEKRSPKWSK